MATYKAIQKHILETHKFSAKTCWIAHVKADHGKVGRPAPNRIASDHRKYPCPDDKRDPIEEALRYFGVI
jgi:hypothetical protein